MSARRWLGSLVLALCLAGCGVGAADVVTDTEPSDAHPDLGPPAGHVRTPPPGTGGPTETVGVTDAVTVTITD